MGQALLKKRTVHKTTCDICGDVISEVEHEYGGEAEEVLRTIESKGGLVLQLSHARLLDRSATDTPVELGECPQYRIREYSSDVLWVCEDHLGTRLIQAIQNHGVEKNF